MWKISIRISQGWNKKSMAGCAKPQIQRTKRSLACCRGLFSFLLADTIHSCLPSVAHLEWDVSATSSVHNTVIKNENLYHSSFSFSLSYYKTLSFVLSSSSPSTYREGALSGNDLRIYSVRIPGRRTGCPEWNSSWFPLVPPVKYRDNTCIKPSPLASCSSYYYHWLSIIWCCCLAADNVVK